MSTFAITDRNQLSMMDDTEQEVLWDILDLMPEKDDLMFSIRGEQIYIDENGADADGRYTGSEEGTYVSFRGIYVLNHDAVDCYQRGGGEEEFFSFEELVDRLEIKDE